MEIVSFEPKPVIGNEWAKVEELLTAYNFALGKYMDQGKNMEEAHTFAIKAIYEQPRRIKEIADAITSALTVEINKENAQ
jgi:hypothetical protein